MSDIGKEILGSINRLNEVYRQGLGSSTRGNAVLVNGKRTDADRSEAEVRAAKPKVRCLQGEVYGDDPFERRMFKRCRDGFDAAIRDAVVAMEDANIPADSIQDFKNIVADFCGDTWNVDPRAED